MDTPQQRTWREQLRDWILSIGEGDSLDTRADFAIEIVERELAAERERVVVAVEKVFRKGDWRTTRKELWEEDFINLIRAKL